MYLASKGMIVAGSRYLLDAHKSRAVLENKQVSDWRLFRSFKFANLRIPHFIRNLKKKDWKSVRTCNMSIFVNDLLEAGGFDELCRLGLRG